MIVFSACVSSPTVLPTGILTIAVTDNANTGQAIQVVVTAQAVSDGTPIGLVIAGRNGPHAYQSTFTAGSANFTIPAEHSRQRGYMALIAASGEAYGEASIILFSQSTASASQLA